MNILFYGIQGSGKSTLAEYTASKLNIPYINSGNLFRELEKEKSKEGNYIAELMRKGELIPNEVSIEVFNRHLSKFDISNGLVLDGYPRNIEQAKKLPVELDLIVEVTIPINLAVERLIERGRYDDKPSAIRNRFKLYRERTLPILEYFKNKNIKVVQVDNIDSIEKTKKKLDGLLEK